jgi:hypothetical protein
VETNVDNQLDRKTNDQSKQSDYNRQNGKEDEARMTQAKNKGGGGQQMVIEP